jgi:hypothetical protein
MLDLAAGVGRTSRLSCQIELTDELDGWKCEFRAEMPGYAPATAPDPWRVICPPARAAPA